MQWRSNGPPVAMEEAVWQLEAGTSEAENQEAQEMVRG